MFSTLTRGCVSQSGSLRWPSRGPAPAAPGRVFSPLAVPRAAPQRIPARRRSIRAARPRTPSPTQRSGGARSEENSAQRSDPNAGAGRRGPYKHLAEGCVAQLALGEVCGVGLAERRRGEISAGEGLDTGRASGRKGGVCALRSCGWGRWLTVMAGGGLGRCLPL